jgi:outer membrane murein-binding lipoprotein Lpp
MKSPWLLGFVLLATLLLSACDTEDAVQSLSEDRQALQETVVNLEAEVTRLEEENSTLRSTLASIGELSADFAEGQTEGQEESAQVLEGAPSEGSGEELVAEDSAIVEPSSAETVEASTEISSLLDTISDLQTRVEGIATQQSTQ